MKVDKLSRIFSAFASSASANTSTQQGESAQSSAAATDGQAVELAKSFGGDSSTGGRSSRVEELRRQIDAGEYKPSSRDVAEAVYNELLV